MVSEVNIVDEYIKDQYLESVSIIGRIDRLFLKTIKVQLEKLNIRDITAAQAMVVYNIGHQVVRVGEIGKRYYKGLNISHNLQCLTYYNYLKQSANVHDTRCKFVMLSEKGLELHATLDELFTTHVNAFVNKGYSIPNNLQVLTSVEHFLKNLIREEENA